MKWLIPDSERLPDQAKQAYWEQVHQDHYQSVWSVTEDEDLRERISAVITKEKLTTVAIVGSGSRMHLERHLLKTHPNLKIICTDYPKVIELAKEKLMDPRLSYLAMDSRELKLDQLVDGIIIVNSVVSESDSENRSIISACAQNLRWGGLLIGLFPTAFYLLEKELLTNEQQALDLSRSTVYEPHQKLEQVFYTPLRLRRILKEAGLSLKTMEVYFCDSEHFLKETERHYQTEDADLAIYEHLVIARRDEEYNHLQEPN
jgi:hypothetical protein